MVTARELVYHFLNLPRVAKMEVACRMRLKGHAQADGSFTHFFKEVKRRGRIEELIHEVLRQEMQYE